MALARSLSSGRPLRALPLGPRGWATRAGEGEREGGSRPPPPLGGGGSACWLSTFSALSSGPRRSLPHPRPSEACDARPAPVSGSERRAGAPRVRLRGMLCPQDVNNVTLILAGQGSAPAEVTPQPGGESAG